MDRPKIGVGVITLRNGRLLLGKRKGSHGAGEWALPGGHLEYGETIETCALRELKEETGLEALSLYSIGWTNDLIAENKHYITFFVLVDRFKGEVDLREPNKCEGWEWIPLDTLPSPLFLPFASFLKQKKWPPNRLNLSILPHTLGICRLSFEEDIPAWALKSSFFSISKTLEELSIVCLEEDIPQDIKVERGWRGIKVEGPLDFSLTGIMASLTKPLAKAGISIFAISTYDTDYLLVKEHHLPKSIEILGRFNTIHLS